MSRDFSNTSHTEIITIATTRVLPHWTVVSPIGTSDTLPRFDPVIACSNESKSTPCRLGGIDVCRLAFQIARTFFWRVCAFLVTLRPSGALVLTLV